MTIQMLLAAAMSMEAMARLEDEVEDEWSEEKEEEGGSQMQDLGLGKRRVAPPEFYTDVPGPSRPSPAKSPRRDAEAANADNCRTKIEVGAPAAAPASSPQFARCPHNRRKDRCKECGGASICEHQRQKSKCKECGGKGLCIHHREKSQCRECGGKGFCKHERRKNECKECGGVGICEHHRIRSQCRDCGGSGICEHLRRRSTCKECGGKGICQHQRRKSRCKDCRHKMNSSLPTGLRESLDLNAVA